MDLAAHLRPHLTYPIYMELFREPVKAVRCDNSFCNACLEE
jgi:hypothetical protein